MIRAVLIAIIILKLQSVLAQCNNEHCESDSLIIHFKTGLFGDTILKVQHTDTSLKFIHRYSVTDRKGLFFQQTATAGRQNKSLLLSDYGFSTFDFGLNAFDAYIFRPENITYFDNIKPYTLAHYIMGPKREQMIEVTHAQLPFKRLYIGTQLRMMNHPGIYFRDKADNSQTYLYANYGNLNDRYRLGATYYFNRFTLDENAGLADHTDFTNGGSTDRILHEVNLQTASSEMRLRGGILQADFAIRDPEKEEEAKIKTGRVYYRFHIQRTGFSFTDAGPLSTYYPVPLINIDETRDTCGYSMDEHVFGWSNYAKKSQILSLGIRNSLRKIKIRQLGNNREFTQSVPEASMRLKVSRSLLINAGLLVIGGNYNPGDYSFTSMLLWNRKDKSLGAGLDINSRTAPYLMQRFESNHYFWDNSFSKESRQILKLLFISGKINIRAEYQTIIKPFYFDEMARPKQYDGIIPTTSISAEAPCQKGIFEMHHRMIYQYSANLDIINIPAFLASGSYMINLELFKKALRVQTGIDVRYFSSWYAHSYNPVTGQFYHQRKQQTGNYLYADFFANFRVSTALLFIKYQHLNAGLTSYNYYLSPDLPMQDAAFIFGLRWMFVN